MAKQMLDEGVWLQGNQHEQPDARLISCSVGIMAYNEEANIRRTVEAILHQQAPSIHINEVIVVASGCTDHTVPILTEIARNEPRVCLCIQEKREGKASAINVFLKQATSPVAVLIGADVIPEISAIEYLCTPFKDPKIGMVGGHPIPVNDSSTFMGHSVHLLWRLHDYLARSHPKLGEVIAFRNVISGIPTDSSVDEISIQALISQLGYQLHYEPSCIVYNKGPLTLRDFLKQRRRIFAGHLRVREQQHYAASTMSIIPIARQLIACRDFAFSTPQQALWSLGTVLLEGIARLQGYYDYHRKYEHQIWQMVDSTKDLEAGAFKVRRLCNAQSVLVFRLIVADGEDYDFTQERQDREATEAARKLLPLARSRLRKADKLSLNGPGILTAVIRAEQHGAELVARRIQEVLQTTPVRIGLRGRAVKVTVTYSTLTFALKGKDRSVTADSPLVEQAMIGVSGSSKDRDSESITT
ncbi:MAG TPA: glycosyltransferase family 2 protein, partial [Ktedonobacteraceae bacterium]|nr:glycosyltransferase family 2 protein [Ktedonobacteraceae bacterium]